ncbi:hypothetical protein [Stappia sp.]|uniref:hypothetical protein n=1 Tax=Stappia sp. TaxID=1870903 RepID=UPI000C966340|nr:hypothetical protein [Stappia sp.]MAB00030.1 hypothetical protein [Stappia sp.]
MAAGGPSGRPAWGVITVCCLLVSTTFVRCSSSFHGVGFIPAPDYVARVAPLAWGAGVAVGLACLGLALAGDIDIFDRLPLVPPLSRTSKWIAAVFASLVLGIGTVDTVSSGPPIVAALTSGKRMSKVFSVKDPRAKASRGCYSRIILADLPWMYSQVCRLDEALRATLEPGSHLMAEGYGTPDGLFIRDFRAAVSPN